MIMEYRFFITVHHINKHFADIIQHQHHFSRQTSEMNGLHLASITITYFNLNLCKFILKILWVDIFVDISTVCIINSSVYVCPRVCVCGRQNEWEQPIAYLCDPAMRVLRIRNFLSWGTAAFPWRQPHTFTHRVFFRQYRNLNFAYDNLFSYVLDEKPYVTPL